MKVDSSVGREVEDLQVWSRVKEVLVHQLKSVVGQAEVVKVVKAGQIISGYLSVFLLITRVLQSMQRTIPRNCIKDISCLSLYIYDIRAPLRAWKPPLCQKDTSKGKKCPLVGGFGCLVFL